MAGNAAPNETEHRSTNRVAVNNQWHFSRETLRVIHLEATKLRALAGSFSKPARLSLGGQCVGIANVIGKFQSVYHLTRISEPRNLKILKSFELRILTKGHLWNV